MDKPSGGPVHPTMTKSEIPGSYYLYQSEGMSLRDKFAEAALPLAAARHTQTYVDRSGYTSEYLPESAYQQTAQDAYAMADAMLTERAK